MSSMLSKRDIISTSSTIQDLKVEVVSSRFILPSTLNCSKQQWQKSTPQRTISILEEHTIDKNHQFLTVNEIVHPVRRNVKINDVYKWNNYNIEIANVLEKIFFKKKRYCFQVLKQFILFPDQTQSEVSSLSLYDPLIFKEEVIHSLVKILQTRLISVEIWGFINIKMLPYLKAAKKIAQKAIKIQEKVMRVQKKVSFDMIKKISNDFISLISKESRQFYMNVNLQTESHTQCISEKRLKENKSLLSSNIVHQSVIPVIRIKPQTNQSHSTTKIYTRQEYERKYGQSASERQDYQPKVIRFDTRDYTQRRADQLPSSRETIRQVQTKIKVEKQQNYQSTKKDLKKYNIIHYHERPRQIIHSLNTYQENQRINASCRDCCTSSCNLCCCCQHEEIHSCGHYSRSEVRSCLHPNQNYKADRINQTAITQKSRQVNFGQGSFVQKKISRVENYELSQLSSRIQYLNFLKNLVREQQEQQHI